MWANQKKKKKSKKKEKKKNKEKEEREKPEKTKTRCGRTPNRNIDPAHSGERKGQCTGVQARKGKWGGKRQRDLLGKETTGEHPTRRALDREPKGETRNSLRYDAPEERQRIKRGRR